MKILLPLSLVILGYGHHAKDCQNDADVGNYFLNFCEEKCVCTKLATNDYVFECFREREEFTCMSSGRRERFINAFKEVTTPGNPQYAQMEHLVQLHGDGFFNGIHDTAFFLPWHRWYIQELENILRNVDCRITVPWWRWSRRSNSPFNAAPWVDHPSQLGGNGAGFGQCVATGPFKTPWQPPLATNSCLRRSFSGTFPTTTQISSVLSISHNNFNTFTDSLEVSIHNTPHNRIGGDMASLLSPRAPEFFLHHAYIDQLWSAWQRKSSNHLIAYGSFNKNTAMPYTVGNPTPDSVFELEKSKIRYVNYQSNPVGRGHFTKLPKCLWLTVMKEKFSLIDVEKVVGGINPKELTVIPQTKWQFLTAEEQKEWIKRDENPETQELLWRKFQLEGKKIDSWNSMLLNPVEKFQDEASQEVGYDVPTIVKMFNLCPIGKKWKESKRKCVRDKKKKIEDLE